MLAKRKGFVKIYTFDTFYEPFLEIKYSVSLKLENFNDHWKVEIIRNENLTSRK